MPDTPSNTFQAVRIESALQSRTIRHQTQFNTSRWFAVFIEIGKAIAQVQDVEFEITGPSVFWAPLLPDTRLKVDAGSVGSSLSFDDNILSDAIGPIVEAAELRLFAQQPVMQLFERNDPRGQELELMFARICEEAKGKQFGTEIMISGYVRLLLVLLWRSVDQEANESNILGSQKAKLNQFRNLVESHFRMRWNARKYADALGLSYDRLHDLCTRSLGKPPALLIRERSLREAQILLQRTSHSTDHIAALLGFSSSSQFNHFYKSMSEETPGKFRQRVARSRADAPSIDPVSFSDWP